MIDRLIYRNLEYWRLWGDMLDLEWFFSSSFPLNWRVLGGGGWMGPWALPFTLKCYRIRWITMNVWIEGEREISLFFLFSFEGEGECFFNLEREGGRGFKGERNESMLDFFYFFFIFPLNWRGYSATGP